MPGGHGALEFPGLSGAYQGSSFSELLKIDYPQLDPAWGEIFKNGMGGVSIPHGTTVLSFKYADGVIVGSAFVRRVLEAEHPSQAARGVAELAKLQADGYTYIKP